MGNPAYATVEQVSAALDFKASAYEATRLSRLVLSASRRIDQMLHRHFYPLIETRSYHLGGGGGFWLGADLFSLTAVTADTVAITISTVTLSPGVAPFHWISQTGVDIDVTGVWGYSQDTTPAGALAEALDASETGVDVTDSSLIGIGDLILVDTEQMIVTAKTQLDTTVDFSSGGTTADKSDNAITLDGPGLKVGESILADSERMLIVEYNSATEIATVKRAWDGSVLATHTTPSVFAPRTLTVERDAVGTTAATHSDTTAITRNVAPGPIVDLCIAEAITTYEQESSGYGRTVGSGDNVREARGLGLKEAREEAKHYKRLRMAAV